VVSKGSGWEGSRVSIRLQCTQAIAKVGCRVGRNSLPRKTFRGIPRNSSAGTAAVTSESIPSRQFLLDFRNTPKISEFLGNLHKLLGNSEKNNHGQFRIFRIVTKSSVRRGGRPLLFSSAEFLPSPQIPVPPNPGWVLRTWVGNFA